MSAIFKAAGGRKNFLVLLAMGVLVALRVLDPEGVSSDELAQWLVALSGIGAAGHALEDGLRGSAIARRSRAGGEE